MTGPRGAGKTRWIQQEVRAALQQNPDARCAIIAAEQGRTRLDRLVRGEPRIVGRMLWLPCLCCPGLVNLPGEARALVDQSQATHLFVELPLLAAVGLIAEFDQQLQWPRRIVLCRDAAWAAAEQADQLTWFQQDLLPRADLLVTMPAADVPP